MDILGYKTIQKLEVELKHKMFELTTAYNLIKELNIENEKFKVRESERKKFFDLMKEKIPEEQNARRNYFTDITMFYQKYFKDKLVQMITNQRDELQIFGRTQREDDFFRANINILNLLDDWFNHAEREYLSDLEETRQKVEENLASVDQINKKYKR